jgi:hypothetical protein
MRVLYLNFILSLYKRPSEHNYLCSSNIYTEALHQRKAQREVVPEHAMKAYTGNRGIEL